MIASSHKMLCIWFIWICVVDVDVIGLGGIGGHYEPLVSTDCRERRVTPSQKKTTRLDHAAELWLFAEQLKVSARR